MHTHTFTDRKNQYQQYQMQKLVSRNQLHAMEVASLRDLCKTEGILTTGHKPDLIARLCALPAPAHQQPA